MTGAAGTFGRGHALIRNLGRGFSRLAAGPPPVAAEVASRDGKEENR
jgi:hypothetical protein